MAQPLYLIAGDGKYGNHRFPGPLKDKPCGGPGPSAPWPCSVQGIWSLQGAGTILASTGTVSPSKSRRLGASPMRWWSGRKRVGERGGCDA